MGRKKIKTVQPVEEVPSVANMKRKLRDHLAAMARRDYSVDKIYGCICKYASRRREYERTIRKLADQIRSAPDLRDVVHSVRFRTKDYFHLVDKLRRKSLANQYPRNITAKTIFDPNLGV